MNNYIFETHFGFLGASKLQSLALKSFLRSKRGKFSDKSSIASQEISLFQLDAKPSFEYKFEIDSLIRRDLEFCLPNLWYARGSDSNFTKP